MNNELSQAFVSESRFYMWRAIFAIAHADGIVTIEETNFLSKCFEMEAFSHGQREILMRDLVKPQNITDMFDYVLKEEDKLDFFIIAEDLGRSDGDFCGFEKKLINALKTEARLGFSPKELQGKLLERKVTREALGSTLPQ